MMAASWAKTRVDMYKKILAAVNEHFNSEIAARYALDLARVCAAKLYLQFVADRRLTRTDQDTAEEAMRRLFAEADEKRIPVERIVVTGDPVEEIGATVRDEAIELAFVSTRKEDVEKRFYAGTVARKLSVRLPCSVALVRAVRVGHIHPARILVPLKATMDHLAERTFFIAKMAEAFHAKVFLFHAPRPATRLFHGPIHLAPGEWETRLPNDVARLIESLRQYKVDFESRIMPGAAGRSITLEASAKRHDLILMGASQRSLWASFLKGNPVEGVLRETPCDLIILNPKHED